MVIGSGSGNVKASVPQDPYIAGEQTSVRLGPRVTETRSKVTRRHPHRCALPETPTRSLHGDHQPGPTRRPVGVPRWDCPQFGRTRRGWDTFKGGRRLVQPAGTPVDRGRWTQTRSARWLLRVLRFESKRSQLLTHERPLFHFGERFPASLQLSQVNEIGPDEVGSYPIVLAL